MRVRTTNTESYSRVFIVLFLIFIRKIALISLFSNVYFNKIIDAIFNFAACLSLFIVTKGILLHLTVSNKSLLWQGVYLT